MTGLAIAAGTIGFLFLVGALIVLTDAALRDRVEREADEVWSKTLADINRDLYETAAPHSDL